MHTRPLSFHRRRAASLVVTLLCITVLTIIVVAFLQSMTLERKTAVSYSNMTRAELAAESAQNEALTRLSSLMAAMPYHAIGYTNVGTGTNAQLYTILYGATNASSTPAPYFLCSTTNTTTNFSALGAAPVGLNTSNSTAVNRRTADGSINDAGWMGSPVTTNGTLVYREARAPWVYILQDPSLPHQPNRSAANYNPRVARYAWWIEDETSKIDITVAGNNEGTSGAFRPAQATNLISTTNTFRDAQITRASLMDAGALPLLNGLPIATNNATANNQLVTFRTNAANPPRDGRFLAQAPGFATSEAKARYYTTMASIANDLAGNGMRRVNLNAIVTEGTSSTNTIASDLDDIAYAITGKHLYANLNTTNDSGHFHGLAAATNTALMPNFGDRFFTETPPATLGMNVAIKRDIYLTKIAANIRDYIDSDSMPTFVDRDGKVFAGQLPPAPAADKFPTTDPASRQNDPLPWAIGKEAIPYLVRHEYSFTSSSKWITSGTDRITDLTFDQFFCFFNPSTKDFIAPSGTFLRVYERPRLRLKLGTGSVASARQLDAFELDLSGIKFDSGQVTVITTSRDASTDPSGSQQYGSLIGTTDPNRLKRLLIRRYPADGFAAGSVEAEEGTRRLTNAKGSGTMFGFYPRGGIHDYQTHMVYGNNQGYYDGFSSITVTYLDSGDPDDDLTLNAPSMKKFKSQSSMRGNDQAGDETSRSGDARSLSEPLAIMDTYISGSVSGQQDQYRFYSTSSPETLVSPNNQYIVPGKWDDWSVALNGSPTSAYAVVRDEPMTSIGELGHIYDPRRRENPASGNVMYSRNGARSLKVGQPDDLIGGATAARFTPTWGNAAWRLTDIFEAVLESDPSNPSVQTANRTDPEAPAVNFGKINLNSVLRDDGQALRALLRGFRFLPTPHSDVQAASRTLSDAEITTLLGQLKTYQTTKGPMMERGELSQLPFFATNGSAGGWQMSSTMDRGREEIFRRILPRLATRSSSFAIHVVAQAVREESAGKVTPLAEALKATVFRFDPVFDSSQPGLLRQQARAFNFSALYDRF